MVSPNSSSSVAVVLLDKALAKKTISKVLEDQGIQVFYHTVDDAFDAVERINPQLLVLPLKTACNEGFDLIKKLDATEVQVVFLRDNPPNEFSLRHRICGYLGKPLDIANLEQVVTEVSDENSAQESENGREILVGESKAMMDLYESIERVAPTDASVFLVGESGTGKDLVAQSIHKLSARRDGPFIPVNCGAINENLIESLLFGHEKGSFTGATGKQPGYFEQADGGTIFLDEITEMQPAHQVRLLRVLETSKVQRVGSKELLEVDVRFIAATNRDPTQAVEEGYLREDLFYRLEVFPIIIPPLRDREKEDLKLLAEKFVEQLNSKDGTNKGLSEEALQELSEHDWPGNVRELKNVIRRAFILSNDDEIQAGDIDTEPLRRPNTTNPSLNDQQSDNKIDVRVGTPIEEVEKELILATLEQCNHDKKKAASVLGISFRTLYSRLEKYKENGNEVK